MGKGSYTSRLFLWPGGGCCFSGKPELTTDALWEAGIQMLASSGEIPVSSLEGLAGQGYTNPGSTLPCPSAPITGFILSRLFELKLPGE